MSTNKLRTFLKRLLIGIVVLGIITVVLAVTLLTRVDQTPLAESAHYHQMQSLLETFPLSVSEGEGWQAGWAVQNALPPVPVNLVGQKRRGHYEFVHQEPQVRALVVNNGRRTVAWLSYETLFVSSLLANRVRQAVTEANTPIDHLVFTATHTHTGMGGFVDRPLGELVFGRLDEEVVHALVAQSLEALKVARDQIAPVTLSTRRIATDGLVGNRLVPTDPKDIYLRQLILTREDGTQGTLVTYSAHPTILADSFMGLAGDYPHSLVNGLEDGHYAFALFAPSTPGSHRPVAGGDSADHVNAYADQLITVLQAPVQNTAELPQKITSALLATATVPLPLQSPHIRISANWRLRPWVYRVLNGKEYPFFDVVRLGDLLLISASAEISGVFVADWEAFAAEQGLTLMLTAFNGEYIGYITPDHYYNTLQNKNEVGTMNWFGPSNGEYFNMIILRLIERAATIPAQGLPVAYLQKSQ